MAPIIIALAAVAALLVHIRRHQTTCAHEIQRLHNQQIVLRRELWDQQAKLGYLASPSRIQHRVDSFSGPLIAPNGPNGSVDQAFADQQPEPGR